MHTHRGIYLHIYISTTYISTSTYTYTSRRDFHRPTILIKSVSRHNAMSILLTKTGTFFFKPFMVALTLRWFCARKGVGYLEGFCASFPPVSLSRSLSLPNTNFWLCMSCRKSLFGFPPTVLEMEFGIPSLSGPTGIYCSRVHSHSTSSGVASRMCASALERPVA